MELTSEEQEIIRRFRQLSESEKKAVLASTNAFIEWIKAIARWIWEKLVESHEIFRIFEDLKQLLYSR